jgi:hypothetical protein
VLDVHLYERTDDSAMRGVLCRVYKSIASGVFVLYDLWVLAMIWWILHLLGQTKLRFSQLLARIVAMLGQLLCVVSRSTRLVDLRVSTGHMMIIYC